MLLRKSSNAQRSMECLALCAARLPEGMATCAVVLPAGEAPPEWMQLMPMGAFKPNDGREGWVLRNAQAVIAASKLPGLIDFDHGTQLRNDSRAAAWIEELAVKGPNGEPGLWGRLDWNDAGRTALASKSYRFFSPTFLYDAARVVTKIVGGSLVNNPALDELPALASNQENNLDLSKLRKALGLSETATLDEIISATAATVTLATASQGKLKLIATAAAINVDVAQLNDDHVTAICAKLTTPAGNQSEQIATLSSQVTTLTGRLNEALLSRDSENAEQLVTQGITDGKIAPALKEEMIAMCKADPGNFKAMLSKAPTVINGQVQLQRAEGDETLTEEQLAICAMSNIKPEDFKKTLKARKKETD